jgi:hypothetical protein
MRKNLSSADKVIRILVAAAIVTVYLLNKVDGTTAIILLIGAGVLVLTSLFNFCPLYSMLGLSSRKKKQTV